MPRPILNRRGFPRGWRKSVTFTTIPLDRRRTRWTYRAKPGMAFNDQAVDTLLLKHARLVEEWFGVEREFRLVELVNGDFNFVEESADKASTVMEIIQFVKTEDESDEEV